VTGCGLDGRVSILFRGRIFLFAIACGAHLAPHWMAISVRCKTSRTWSWPITFFKCRA
jgi:hypothetical protein